MGRILTLQDVEFAVRGGAVFACGGGGWVEHGRELGTMAVTIGRPEIVNIEELNDNEWVATAAAIGAPGGLTEWEMLGSDYVKAAKLLADALGEPLSGLIIGQNGMSSTVNAWLPSALLGLKVIDAVGDVRAHPTGDMGSLGLANSPDQMIQTAVGGNRSKNQYIELVTRGATAKVSPILRKASDMSGGFIASCRNPIRAGYVRQHAALGGISLALKLGEAMFNAEKRGGSAVIDAICKATDGHIICSGKISENTLRYTDQAFDVGVITVGEDNNAVFLHTMNEYMAVDNADGQRIASYPDVITVLGDDGQPISAGKLKPGMSVHVFLVAKNKIPLASSVKDPSVYPPVEEILGINLSDYALSKEA
ncbi:DUF917 domain-containing protein [Pasteurella skyensis]|uniref:DUF917 domain-containing protein n=1 Tax=Phocoenobacter skyensis TaxID=97481 RepID=A0AAJ6N937_9PAST|nr:DUF917 domain-containing protein [Pasteurella skyensis]MDP8162502.1 DUF917 domain-containing protein [Pasteurella skyensis]MDP8172467.1 DUF917 domain-containing protein [Pasteurella skyensis]MDP8177492.1 DUF917 domain-containing protein [Pasteurella skyensis]MDP8178722.1 DUF917 domain-containing protein [Pasteurella skyensis]MDP8182988.1 DUF917 domain-containing protein [Pasteurella skyensis]